jgi:hypothetical protein
MRIRLAIPDELDDQDRKAALDAALESVTRTVDSLVRNGIAPPAAGPIKAGTVRWKPEPPGDEHFDLPTTVLERGHGDCDDLAPWHAGSLRASGTDPGARAIVRKSGPKRWHAIVQRTDGSIEDPSAHAGMHSVGGGMCHGAGPAITEPMSEDGHLCLAICPTQDLRHAIVWFARCDIPDTLEPWNWSATSAHLEPSRALLQAVKTAKAVAGDAIDEEDDLRLGALNDLVLGADPEEVAEVLGEMLGDEAVEEILGDAMDSVGFFGGLLKGVKSVAKAPFKIAKKAFGTGRQVITAPFKIPGMSQVVRAGLPMAATYFGGAPAGMVTRAVSPYIVPKGPNLPGYAGKALNLLPGLAQAAASGDVQQVLSQLTSGQAGFPELERFIQGIPGARTIIERGIPSRPWGTSGPMVMRY